MYPGTILEQGPDKDLAQFIENSRIVRQEFQTKEAVFDQPEQ